MSKCSGTFKILLMLMMLLSVLITTSIFVLVIIALASIILVVREKINVKLCIKNLKYIVIWLIFIVILYIILVGNEFNIFLLIFKFILTLFIIELFLNTINFQQMNQGLNRILSPLKKFNINYQKFSYNLSMSIYFLNILWNNGNKNKKSYKDNVNKKESIINNINKAVRYSDEFEELLTLKFYNSNKKEKISKKERIIIFVVFMFLILVLIRK